MIPVLSEAYHRLISELKEIKTRYLFDSFNINNRMTGLIGPRGVGKTTLLLQYIKQHLYHQKNTIYVSADNFYFNSSTLYEFVDTLYKTEHITIFFFDEVHKYPNWNQELKNIYDAFPSIKVVFSGSSSIDLVKGSYDLSRRVKLYHLLGLSFREYLNFLLNLNITPIQLDDLNNGSQQFFNQVSAIPKLAGHFNDYLMKGYYPFIFENSDSSYYEKIIQIVEKSIYEDIAKFYRLNTENLQYFGKILHFLSIIPPGELRTHTVAKNLQINDKTVDHYFEILRAMGLVRDVCPFIQGNQALRKTNKKFIDNTSLLAAINHYNGSIVNPGTMRELYFLQSCQNAGIDVLLSHIGDFEMNKVIYEIGGKNKKRKQITSAEMDAFIVKDDILYPSQGILPLWSFGFLY
jgi:predicted AAA+ superfamily ATPase